MTWLVGKIVDYHRTKAVWEVREESGQDHAVRRDEFPSWLKPRIGQLVRFRCIAGRLHEFCRGDDR